MIISKYVVGPLEVNCYVIGDPVTKEVIIIDPGGNPEKIYDIVQSNRYKVSSIINTHVHFDHVGGIPFLCKELGTGYQIHEEELPLLSNIQLHAQLFGINISKLNKPTSLLHHGDTVTLGQYSYKIFHTPGHSPGSICIYCEKSKEVLTGDTLFFESIGRTDLPGGSFDTLKKSITKTLLSLPDETQVFPGHGASTSISHEKQFNPFIA